MGGLTGKNILFISPKFFNYEIEISKELKSLGAQVNWIDERPSNTFFSKVIIRLNKNFLSNRIKKYYVAILNQFDKNHFDYILIISPETLTPSILRSYKDKFQRAKVILYMWDSFKNKGALALIPIVEKVISFDPNDAKKYGLKFRPLFFIDHYKAIETEMLYNFLFIGTAHSDRYVFVKNLVKTLPEKWKIKLYFYLSSKKLFWVKRAFDANFKKVEIKDISFVSLSHEQNAALMHSSAIILDINHPEQLGLTMRTLETLGAQKKLLTTNGDIVNYDFYHPNNILVIDRSNPILHKDFLNSKFSASSTAILQKYSLKGWIEELFELK